MWIFTIDGFFSAVEHRDQRECVMIRARYEEDLKKLKGKVCVQFEIESTPHADYPYRLTVTKKLWAAYVSESALYIDYDNFKDAALKGASPKRNSQYHEVWLAMSAHQSRMEGLFDEPLHRDVDSPLEYSEAIRKVRKLTRDKRLSVNMFQMSTLLAHIYGITKKQTMYDLIESK